MRKIKIEEGSHEEMLKISQFLLRRGFTPVFSLKKGNGVADGSLAHQEGGGWQSQDGVWEWRSKEPILYDFVVEHFELPPQVQICHFPDHPEAGISLAADGSHHAITSVPLEAQRAGGGAQYDCGTPD